MASPATKPRIAVLVHHGYQELEFWYPLLRLREEEIDAIVLGLDGEATYVSNLGYPVIPDQALASEPASAFAGIVIPGGNAGDAIAAAPEMVRFVSEAAAKGAVIGAVGKAEAVLKAAGLKTGGKIVAAPDANALPAFFREFRSQLN